MDDNKKIFELLAQFLMLIPSSFWGVIFGSVFSLIGVILTNRHNYKRTELQFKYDREIRRSDRERAMFQDVYLAASEVIADRLAAIMRFSDLRIPDHEILVDPDRKGGAIAKAQLISDECTRDALAKVGSALTSSYLRLATKRAPIGLKLSHGKYLDRRVEELLEKQKSINNLMAQFNIEGKSDQRQWAILKQDFDFYTTELESILKRRDEVYEEVYSEQIIFLEECFEETLLLICPCVNATYEMRSALDLQTNKDELLAAAQRDVDEMRAVLRTFIERAKVFMAEGQSSAPW
jgi:hypothetical protein